MSFPPIYFPARILHCALWAFVVVLFGHVGLGGLELIVSRVHVEPNDLAIGMAGRLIHLSPVAVQAAAASLAVVLALLLLLRGPLIRFLIHKQVVEGSAAQRLVILIFVILLIGAGWLFVLLLVTKHIAPVDSFRSSQYLRGGPLSADMLMAISVTLLLGGLGLTARSCKSQVKASAEKWSRRRLIAGLIAVVLSACVASLWIQTDVFPQSLPYSTLICGLLAIWLMLSHNQLVKYLAMPGSALECDDAARSNERPAGFCGRWNSMLFQRYCRRPEFLALLFVSLTYAGMRSGPDFAQYLAWSRAALSGDIYQLDRNQLSATGIPMHHWSPAPGLVFALPRWLSGQRMGLGTSAFLAGWLCSLITWYNVVRIVWWSSGGNRQLLFLGLALTMVGTQLGRYSLECSSEIISLMAASWLVAELVRPSRPSWVTVISIGCAAALLGFTRSYFAIYALPCWSMLLVRVLFVQNDGGAVAKAVRTMMLIGLPSIGVAWLLLVNYWMTGVPWRSPYTFGDVQFQSLDWGRSEWIGVLISPANGAVVFHPLYLCGLLSVILLLVKSRHSEKVAWCVCILWVAVNVYIQSCWYEWSMGDCFGNRGLCVFSLFLPAGVVRLLRNYSNLGSGSFYAILAVISLCCAWSYLALLRGTTTFSDYHSLFQEMFAQTYRIANPRFLSQLLIGAGIVHYTLGCNSLGTDADRPRGTDGKLSQRLNAISIVALLLMILSLGFVISEVGNLRNWWWAGVVVAALLLLQTGLRWADRTASRLFLRQGGAVALVAKGSAICLLTLVSVLFATLAIPTHIRILQGQLPCSSLPRHSFDAEETVLVYRNFPTSRWHKSNHRALQGFLERQRLLPSSEESTPSSASE